MASTFTGLAIASRGLMSSELGLTVTTNNSSNVNTTGYSRQVLNQVAIGPAAVYSGNGSAYYVGSGSDVTSVTRVRNFRLDQKYWQENTSQNEWATKADYLKNIENALGTSSSDNTFNTTMDTFYSALENLSADPGSTSQRSVVQEDGEAVCDYLNTEANQLTQERNDVNGEVKTSVDQINSYTGQIAALNQRISVATAAGASANELEDQRDLLVDKLSAITDVQVSKTTVSQAADGSTVQTYTITSGNVTLVSGNQANQLECSVSSGSTDGMYSISLADTGAAYTPAGGSLKAELDLRDGDGVNGSYKGIVYYQNQLNDYAVTFAKAFDTGVYKDGSDSAYGGGFTSGYGSDGTTGTYFFTYRDSSGNDVSSAAFAGDYTKLTAANICLSSDVEENVAKIAASDSGDTSQTDNNNNLEKLIKICQDPKMFASGTPEDAYDAMISTLGTAAAYASQQSSVKSSIVSYLDNSRNSVSGVSTNEESANLTKYQQAYEASAKTVTTWNEIYQTTIDMVNSDGS